MKRRIFYIVVAISLFVIGGQFEIPLGHVPFILTDLFIFFAALRLKPLDFSIAVLAFLLLGAFGLPVFAGGAGGIDHLFGPTSGYLFGYLIGGLWVSFTMRFVKNTFIWLFLVFTGYYILFAMGVSVLSMQNDMNLAKAFKAGAIPFVLSMHLKGLVAWGLHLLLMKSNL